MCFIYFNFMSNIAFILRKLIVKEEKEIAYDIDNSLIRSIPYWIVETHSSSIIENILKKFEECGFKKCKEFVLYPSIILYSF